MGRRKDNLQKSTSDSYHIVIENHKFSYEREEGEREREIHMRKISTTIYNYLPKISKEEIPQCYKSKTQGQGEINNNINISNYSLIIEEQNNREKIWTKSGKMKH